MISGAAIRVVVRITYVLLLTFPECSIALSVPTSTEVSKRIDACIASGSTIQQKNCLGSLRVELDGILNAEYARVKGDLSSSPRQLSLLKTAEHKWIQYRDAHCAFDASGELGGSLGSVEIITCSAELTGDRARYLETKK